MSDALIRFAAPLALLDTWTTDGRMLRTPADGRLRHRPLPFPLRFMRERNDAEGSAEILHVGMIEGLFLGSGTVVAFCTLPDTVPGRRLARELEAGELFLELDVDDVQMLEDPTAAPITGLIMKSWRVSGVVLGTRPCWELEAAQVVRPEGGEPDGE